MNRFVAGQRIWQRNTAEIAISVIKAKDDDAKLRVVKQTFAPGMGLTATRACIEEATANRRGAAKTVSKKEVDLVTHLPRVVINTLSILVAMGKAAPMPFATDDGGLAVRPGLTLRFAFDERVADGF